MIKYKFEVYWSDEDQTYIAQALTPPYFCIMTDGKTVSNALKELSEAISIVDDELTENTKE